MVNTGMHLVMMPSKRWWTILWSDSLGNAEIFLISTTDPDNYQCNSERSRAHAPVGTLNPCSW